METRKGREPTTYCYACNSAYVDTVIDTGVDFGTLCLWCYEEHYPMNVERMSVRTLESVREGNVEETERFTLGGEPYYTYDASYDR